MLSARVSTRRFTRARFASDRGEQSINGMQQSIIQYFRCPERYVHVAATGQFSAQSGYFRFGGDALCYGQCGGATPSNSPEGDLYDALNGARIDDGTVLLPFDLQQVVENLRLE